MTHAPDSAVDTVRAFAERIAGLSPEEHGFTHLALDQAMARAEQLDTVPVERRGRLHGLLLPIKDLTEVAGMPTSYGSAHRVTMSTESAPVVTELLAQGVIIPGKTAAPELGMTGYTEPVGLPAPENPRYPGQRRTPGGSSGGAAVAVGRGLVDVAHASDGGGSIRIPAAACGLVGFKQSHAAVGGALSVQGVLTRSVATTAALHQIDPAAPAALADLRIGVLREPLLADTTVAPERRAVLDRAADLLSDAGYRLSTLSAADLDAAGLFHCFRKVFSAKVANVADPVSPIVGWCREFGRGEPPYAEIARLEGSAREVARAFDVDVLLSPYLAWDPPRVGFFSGHPPAEDFEWQTKWSPWGSLCNMTGAPAISLPATSAGGNTVDLQLAGVQVGNSRILGLATQLEQLLTPARADAR